MKRLSSSFAKVVLFVGIAGWACLSFAQVPVQTMGGVLTDSAGMTLYVFDKDTANSGKSVCNGPCAANWPALTASAGDVAQGDYTIIKRDDGKMQWAYMGRPLYRWSKDKKPGDMTGDGFINAWHVVKP